MLDVPHARLEPIAGEHLASADHGRHAGGVADRLALQFGMSKIYKSTNPFDFMELISLEGKTNFFEKKVSEYSKPGVGMKSEDMVFRTDEEF